MEKAPGQRGSSKKSCVREDLAIYIYKRIREEMAERSSCQEKRLILSFSPKSFIYSHILSVANSNIQLFSQSFLQSFNQSNVISSVIQPIKR